MDGWQAQLRAARTRGGAAAWYTGLTVAYQPKGAANYVASLTNLCNPGTYDASAGAAPSWAAATGWTFAANAYLIEGGPNLADNTTIMVQYAAVPAPADAYLAGAYSGVVYGIIPWYAGTVRYWGGTGSVSKTPELAAGNLCIAGNALYRNGVAEGAPGIGSGRPPLAPYIAALNLGGSAGLFCACRITAYARVQSVLDAPAVAALAAAMAAL